MQYIIMCGGTYKLWEEPRHFTMINGEKLIERTIRQLREHGIRNEQIAISSNDDRFAEFGVKLLKHENSYVANGVGNTTGHWCDCFYMTSAPTCYLFGDVVFSDIAISTIINTGTYDIEFFASAPPFSDKYCKEYAEPFALKVFNQQHFHRAIRTVKVYTEENQFARKPIMWEVWQVIKNTPLNCINFSNYTAINDYTCDIDAPEDIDKILANM